MSYFVTGGTGFIGQNLIPLLLARRGTVYVLVRTGSLERLDQLKARWGRAARKIVPVTGDLTRPFLGISPAQRKKLQGKIDHVFHLAAIYDLKADASCAGGRQHQGHDARGPFRRGRRCKALPSRQFHRRRGALSRHLHRGHVRGSHRPREPLFQDQARLRGNRPQEVLDPLAHLPARYRGG